MKERKLSDLEVSAIGLGCMSMSYGYGPAAADVELTPDDLREIEDAQLTAHGARYGERSQQMVDR